VAPGEVTRKVTRGGAAVSVRSIFLPNTAIREMHLMPGLVSPRLDHLLWIRDQDEANNVRADTPPTGVTVTFQALFIGAPDNHGVKFNETTGEITIKASWSAGTRLRSFIVLCGASEGANIFSKRIRVNVHESMTRMWLSPFSVTANQGSLTVREDAENMRLSVMAEFDDGVVGDITNWSPHRLPKPADRTFVHQDGKVVPVLEWSSTNAAEIAVNATGLLTCTDAAASETVTARWPPAPAPATQSADATVKGAPAWTAGVPITHVQGPGPQGLLDPRVHNILFLPDGFANTTSDFEDFNRYVRAVVTLLRTNPLTRPFDLFTDSLNYFMAWVPSPDAGISVLNELDRVPSVGPNEEAVPIDPPSAPRVPAEPQWAVKEIVNEVGMPTPKFDPVGSPLGTEVAGRLKEWRELYGEDITSALVTPNYAGWLDLSDRVLLNERDTAFHFAISHRPGIDDSATERDLGLHDLRMTEADLDRFLDNLQDSHGTRLPLSPWVSGRKDHDLVAVLCRSNANAGANTPRTAGGHYLALSLDWNGSHHLKTNAAGFGFDLDPDPISRTVSPDTWTTVAHELAHSWSLKDEYGRGGVIDVNSANDLLLFANAQPRSTLVNGDNLELTESNLKWDWPRLEKAAVMIDQPTGADPFRIKLRKGHGYPFGRGDIVLLRTRPLLDPAVKVSGRLKIKRMLGDGDEIEVTPLAGVVLNPADFPADSVVIAPRRGPDPNAADDGYGPDLKLVHKSVFDRINATHNPLNAEYGDATNRPCPGEAPTPTGATNFHGGIAPKPPRYSSWIVGLYENAKGFDCDVYRPTGTCLMRRRLFVDIETGRTRVYQFCPVCRYAIVDLIDPSKHGIIDRDYAPRYPK
jgi:hypothetical protein